MGVKHNVREVARRLQGFQEALPAVLKKIGKLALTKVGAEATSTYMQDAGAGASPRSESDTGPLRIVTARIARSILGAATGRQREGFNTIDYTGGVLSLTKGSHVPYAAAHEHGFHKSVVVPQHQRSVAGTPVTVRSHSRRMNIKKRPYLSPALKKSLGWIQRTAAEHLDALMRRFVR